MKTKLNAHHSPDATPRMISENAWHLEIPQGPSGHYRIAQIDDYSGLKRRDYLHAAPFTMQLDARVSSPDLPGTWGFGLWNSPLSLAIGFGGNNHLPALPNAAWFFHSSPENHLSFSGTEQASGFLAQTFKSPIIPALWFAPTVPLLPLFAIRPAARIIRRLISRFLIRDERAVVPANDLTAWHRYQLDLQPDRVTFRIDDGEFFSTNLVPTGPLGLVIWIDNQYAAFTPDGRLAYGVLENRMPARLEIRNLEIQSG